MDVISEGRLIVGVGAGGEFPDEFRACGVPLEARGARLEEGVELLRRYWSGETIEFEGRFYAADGLRLDLVPAQAGGPPVWIGGRSVHAQERAGRIGDGYLPYIFTPEQCREAWDVVEAAAESVGRELPDDFPFALQQYICVDDDPRKARARAVADLTWRYDQPFDRLVDRYCIYGPQEKCLEALTTYVDAGVTHFLLSPVAEPGGETEAVAQVADVLLGKLRRAC